MIFNKTNILKWCDIAIESGFFIFIIVTPIQKHTATIKSLGLAIPLLAWIIKIIINKRIDWVKTPLNIPFILFILISLISICFSVNINDSLWSFKHFLLKFILIYFIIVNNIKSNNQIKRLLCAIVIINTIHSSASIYNYLIGLSISGIIGTYAFSLVHNALGKFLTMTIPIIGIFYSLSKDKIGSYIYAFIFILSAASLILTYSRSSWIAFIVSMILWSFFKDRKSIAIFITVCITSSFFVFPSNMKTRVVLGLKKQGLQNRPAFWEAGLAMVSDKPVIGFGYGSGIYAKLYSAYRPKDAYKELPSHVHNMYLATAVESGVLGFFSFLWVLYIYLKELLKSILRLSIEPDRTILIGILTSLVGFLVIGLVEIMMINQNGMYFWILSALAMVVTVRRSCEVSEG